MAQILVDREGNRFKPSSQIQIGDVIYYHQDVKLSEEVIAHYGLHTIDTSPFENKPVDYDTSPDSYYVTEEKNVPYFVYTLKSADQLKQQHNSKIWSQISSIETASLFPRQLREVMLEQPGAQGKGWYRRIKDVDDEVAVLKSQLLP